LHVTLDEGGEVVAVPNGSAGRSADDGFGKATCDEALGELARSDFILLADDLVGKVVIEDVLKKSARALIFFGFGEGKEIDDFHTASEGFAEAGKGEEVGGASEDEFSGTTILVDRHLDGTNEREGVLDFINGDLVREVAEITLWVLEDGFEELGVIEGDIGSVLIMLLSEGAFAALAGA